MIVVVSNLSPKRTTTPLPPAFKETRKRIKKNEIKGHCKISYLKPYSETNIQD